MLIPSLLCRGRCLGRRLGRRKNAKKKRRKREKSVEKKKSSDEDDDGAPSVVPEDVSLSTASAANVKPEGGGNRAPLVTDAREDHEDRREDASSGAGGASGGGYGPASTGSPRPPRVVGCPLLSEASSFSLVVAIDSRDTPEEEDDDGGSSEGEDEGDDYPWEIPEQSSSPSSVSSQNDPQLAEVDVGNDEDFGEDDAFPPLLAASSSLSYGLVKLFQEEDEEHGGEGGEGIISPPDTDALHLVAHSSSGIASAASTVGRCASGTTPDETMRSCVDDDEQDVEGTTGDCNSRAALKDEPVEATQVLHRIGDGGSAAVAGCEAGAGESSIAAAVGGHPLSSDSDDDDEVSDASLPAAPSDEQLVDDGNEPGPVISSGPSSDTASSCVDDEGEPEREQRQATEVDGAAHERGDPDEDHDDDDDEDRVDAWRHYGEIEATDSHVEVTFSLSPPRTINEDTHVIADEDDDETDECSELEVGTDASATKRRSGDEKLTPGLVEDEEGSLRLKRARTSTTLRKAAPIRFDGWACCAPNGVGGGSYAILGTSANDLHSRPHVLSPPLMESLRSFLPFSCSEENFWMKYSLIRDGGCYETLLSKVRSSRRTVLAIETMEGEVFGSFTSSPWRVQPNFFGSGEAFLWRLKKSRWFVPGDNEETTLLRRLDSEIEVYPYTNFDNYIQLCTHDRMAVGGGQWQPPEDCPYPDELAEGGGGGGGMGLVLGEELETGSSHTCATFASPGLSRLSSMNGGRQFQIANVEVWTLTPFSTLQTAETSDLRKSFIEDQTTRAVYSY